jgi:hypothetical protein
MIGIYWGRDDGSWGMMGIGGGLGRWEGFILGVN